MQVVKRLYINLVSDTPVSGTYTGWETKERDWFLNSEDMSFLRALQSDWRHLKVRLCTNRYNSYSLPVAYTVCDMSKDFQRGADSDWSVIKVFYANLGNILIAWTAVWIPTCMSMYIGELQYCNEIMILVRNAHDDYIRSMLPAWILSITLNFIIYFCIFHSLIHIKIVRLSGRHACAPRSTTDEDSRLGQNVG